MTKTKKRFDSVAMKRRGAAAVRRRLRGATREEQLAFWEARTAALLEQKRQAKADARTRS